MLDLAIVGGGPGGLMSAWYLKKKLGELCRVTIFEASDRRRRQDPDAQIRFRARDVRGRRRRDLRLLDDRPRSAARADPAFRPADHSDGCRAGSARRRTAERRAGHAPQIRRQDRGRDRGVPQALRRRWCRRSNITKASARTTTSIPGPTSRCEELLDREVEDATAKRFFKVMARSDHCDREPQHQRAQCAEELRDGCRRLYRPVFDPERQRAVDRVPAVRGRCRHPAQSPRSQGRQDREPAATSST